MCLAQKFDNEFLSEVHSESDNTIFRKWSICMKKISGKLKVIIQPNL